MNAGDIVIELKLDDRNMEIGIKNAGQLLRQFQGTLGQTARSVRRLEEAQFSLGTSFRHLVVTLGNLRFALMDVYDAFLRLPISIIKSAGELERMQFLLKGLSTAVSEIGREADGKKDFAFLTNLAKVSPFEIGALTQSFVKLKAAGLDPTKGAMQSLVDSVARFGGSGEQFNRASVAISQMLGKGVVSMEELRQQLGEAIPTAMQDMADGMGLSMAELTDKVGKGQVKAERAISQMLARMAINNEGAAAAMMKSWVGATAQLKTEWQLATLAIANGGFFESAKKALDEIAQALRTPEFMRFAADFGSAIGGVITSVSNLVKTIYEWRDAILGVAVAFAAYKVASGVVNGENGKAIASGIKAGTNAYKEQSFAAIEAATKVKASAVERARAEVQAAGEARRASRDLLAQKQTELTQLRALQTQQLAEAKRLADISAQARPRNADGTFMSKAALRQQLVSLEAVEAATRRSRLIVEREIGAVAAAHNANTAAMRTSVTQMQAVAAGKVQVARSANLAKAAISGMGTAFNALGGWLTVLNLALAVGVGWWVSYGNAASDAADRVRRAREGVSSSEDLKKDKGALEEVRQERARLEKELNLGNIGGTRGQAGMSAEAKSRTQDRINFLLMEEARMGSIVKRHEKNIAQIEIDSAATERAITTERLVQAEAAAGQKRIAAIKEERKKALESFKGTDAGLQALRNSFNDREAAAQKSSIEAQLKIFDRDIEALNKQLTSSSGDAAQGITKAIDRLVSARTQAEAKLGENKKLSLGADLVEGKDKNKAGTFGEDKLKAFIAGLADDKARLQELIDGYVATGQKVSEVDAARKAVLAKWEAGGFDRENSKTKEILKPAAGDVDMAAQVAAEVQALKEQERTLESVIQQLSQQRPEFERATSYLSNPNEEGRLDKGRAQFEKFFNGLRVDMEKAPPKVKEAFERLKAELSAGFDAIDISAIRRKQEEDLTEIGTRTVQGERERARQIIEIERDRNIKSLQLAKDRALASGDKTGIAAQADQLIENARRIADDKIAKSGMTALQRLAQQWKDSAGEMEQASVGWANATSDAFVEMASTGKFAWKGLVEQILKDILRIQVQKMIAGLIGNMIGGFSSAGASGGQVTNPGYNGDIGTFFADGGIMSSFGSLPLKKYAKGGIAKSPQMAVFGEGSMNEAYVPLPDGRSIPVTMRGQSAPAVTVNVINQSGTPVNAQQGQPRFDGKQMILDVVLEASSKPGNFRNGMRNMMGTP